MSEGPPTSGFGSEPEAQPAQPEVPAGWYPHPTAPGWEAYWTGTGWGTETRPAQAPPAAPEAPAEPQAEPEQAAPAQTTPAQEATEAAPMQTTPAQEATEAAPAEQTPAASLPATAATTGGAPPGAVATPAAAAAGASAAAAGERSNSSLPVVLCVLGAIVTIVGAFLPLATSSFEGIDFTDNTFVGQGLGIAVIAVAVLGAALAVWSYLQGNRTWLVVLLGVVIVAIAAYMGLVGIDDLSPDIPVVSSPGGGQFSGDLSEAINPDASPSTGIFAVAVGGLLMALGGIGLARENR